MSAVIQEPISRHIWETKYRFLGDQGTADASIQDTWRRVARALASIERDAPGWEGRFLGLLEDFRFLPGGRILAGAGTERRVTLFNCFVMGVIEDSMDGIFDGLKEAALTMQQGGGVGFDFSTLRPSGTHAKSVGGIASGPVSFMQIWDAMCGTLLSSGARRGAMMGTLRCDHPDIEAFIEAKHSSGQLRNFNLSVLVFDDFLQAVADDATWPLVFPIAEPAPNSKEIVYRRWTGTEQPVACRIHRRVSARALWEKIMRATYAYAEPGVLFIDRINQLNNLGYREHISATNPCGEEPLPPYGACNLGSVNLTRFVEAPFSAGARLDFEGIEQTTRLGARLLDNVIDCSGFPLEQQALQARGSRRIGLGITGLADALIMLGIRYGSDEAVELAGEVMRKICHSAYRASIELAREKEPFPYFERDGYLSSPFVQSLPDDIRNGIVEHGIRNSHLTAIAPTGTISLLADNVSSGLEPALDFEYHRRVLDVDGNYRDFRLQNYALRRWRAEFGDAPLPEQFATVSELTPREHLRMQAALQPYVDSAISKTINVPEDFPFEAFESLYLDAWRLGLKGCTTYRPNPITGAVLTKAAPEPVATQCCSIDREAD
jgi:ribonucleoside-diphosphate reductase alpha chain